MWDDFRVRRWLSVLAVTMLIAGCGSSGRVAPRVGDSCTNQPNGTFTYNDGGPGFVEQTAFGLTCQGPAASLTTATGAGTATADTGASTDSSTTTGDGTAAEGETRTTSSGSGSNAAGPDPSQACLQRFPTLPVVSFHGFCGVRPSSIDVSGDAGNVITSIAWSMWSTSGAEGVGTSMIQSCVTDCASGGERSVRTAVAFSNPHDGVFETMTETRAGRTSSYQFVNGDWPYAAS